MRNAHATESNFDDFTRRPEPRTTRAVADKAHETVDKLADRVAGAESSAREAAGATSEKLAARKQDAQAKVDDAMSEINRFVQKNPLASTGIAFAAGALLTSLLGRKS